MTSFAIRSTKVLIDGSFRPALVVVSDEKIQRIDPSAVSFQGDVIEAGDACLLPGLVDSHVHVNEPGRTEWEGFITATQAASAGGITTLADMPLNSIPVTTTPQALEIKARATEGKLATDVLFYGGVVPNHAAPLAELTKMGVAGAKAFLCHSGIDDFPNVVESQLREAMIVLGEAGRPLLAHAEIDLGASPIEKNPRSYRSWLESRPTAYEDAAIELLIKLCRETRCRVHIVHLSAATALPLIRAAKDEGLPLSVETCPHYLTLAAEEIEDGRTEFKCAPPIRERKNQDALWAGLLDGTIDFVVSDHSPCVHELKKPDTGDFLGAWGGIASVSLGLNVFFTEASRRGIPLSRVVDWLSTRPARFLGLGERKGSIAVGHDADLVLFDDAAKIEVDQSRLYFRNKVSPYLGKTMRGEVLTTWVRGHRSFDRRKHPTENYGRMILSR